MATDGVKIIDGDLAHDTSWRIMDLYDSNVDTAIIRKEIPFVRSDYGMTDKKSLTNFLKKSVSQT